MTYIIAYGFFKQGLPPAATSLWRHNINTAWYLIQKSLLEVLNDALNV